MAQLTSLLGLGAMVLLAMLLSVDRRSIVWRPVIGGIVLQFAFAALILGTDVGDQVFTVAKDVFVQIIAFSNEGTDFVFPGLREYRSIVEIPNDQFIKGPVRIL